jgi:hypothetical protein
MFRVLNSALNTMKNNYVNDMKFYTNYINHLKNKVLELNESRYIHDFQNFLHLLYKNNVYIVGHSLLYFKLGLDGYNDKLDLFININNLQSFLDNIYMEFIPISLKFTSKYSTLDENIIEVVYKFKFTNDKDKEISKEIVLHICNDINIDDFIKKNLSIFSIWFIPSTDSDQTIYINNTTKQLFDIKKTDKIQCIIPSNLNLTKEEIDLLETKNLSLNIENNIETTRDKAYYDAKIIKILISNLSKYLFILTDETPDIRGPNVNSLLLDTLFIHKSEQAKKNYIYEYNMDDNFINKYKILTSLDFILYMYNNNNKKSNNFYTYTLFYKAFIEFTTNYDILMEKNAYIDKVIREEILNNYNITIKIDDDNNINFNLTTIDGTSTLNSNDEIFIKQLLLFYYKEKIYKCKSDYKFVDLITNNDSLVEINFNIHTDKQSDRSTTIFNKFNDYNRLLLYPELFSYNKVPPNFKDIKYFNMIIQDDGFILDDITDTNIKDYIDSDIDNIILVDPNEKKITCISKSDLDKMISIYKDIWFYDCSKFHNNTYLKNAYIGVNTASNSYYIHYKYLFSLFKSTNKLFYINPTNETIKKTAIYRNTPIGKQKKINSDTNDDGNYKCDDGSNITLATISTIKINTEAETSDISIAGIEFNTPYQLLDNPCPEHKYQKQKHLTEYDDEGL